MEWTSDCEVAFQELKISLGSLELLSTTELGEPLYLYLGILKHTVSSALVQEECGTKKCIYYVSKTLLELEKRYTKIQNLLYTIVM